MTRDEFRALVDEALADDSRSSFATPCRTSRSSSRTSRQRARWPKSASSRRTRCSGLYEGTPLTERQWAHGNVLPDKITLFQGPIEESSDDREDTIVAIAETLIHEIGHYFGLSEEEIEEIEDRYWHGEDIDEDEEGEDEDEGDAPEMDEDDDDEPDGDEKP